MLRSNPVADLRADQREATPPLAPFDFYLDGWSTSAAALQASGDLALVRLPFGFFGGLVIRGRDVGMEMARGVATRQSGPPGPRGTTCS